jgi:hypothetical protein
MAPQVTEILYITLKPGVELDDSSPSAQAWKDTISTLQRQDGFLGMNWGLTIESPNLLIGMIRIFPFLPLSTSFLTTRRLAISRAPQEIRVNTRLPTLPRSCSPYPRRHPHPPLHPYSLTTLYPLPRTCNRIRNVLQNPTRVSCCE